MFRPFAFVAFVLPLIGSCSSGSSDASGGAGQTSRGGAGGTPMSASGGALAAAGGFATAMSGASGSSLSGGTSNTNAAGGAVASGGSTSSGGAVGVAGMSGQGGAAAGGSSNAGAPSSGGSSPSAGGGGRANGGAGGVVSAGSGGRAGGGAGGASSTGGASAGASSLRDKYASDFPIGAAVDSMSYMTHAAVLTKHFNSVTPENEMKFDALEPNENSFTYSAADKIVDFAVKNDMKVRGHTLVWYNQNPSWVFSNGSGGTASKDVLLARMKNHISNVMRHYRGKVYAWDVVNEAIMDDGTYRDGNQPEGKQSQWYAIIGKSYIAEAFKAAHEADPDAKLFYNDYYNYLPARQQAIYDMLKELVEQGVPVHGVGMQCHLNIQPSTDSSNQSYYQTVENLEKAIQLYSSLGLDVQVTELDVSLYISGMTYTSDQFYTAATFTDALQQQQADRYREFFELFRKYKDVMTGVTLWGIADDNTWLSEFSSGRKDFPLLFDANHNPKKAYYAVTDF